MAPLFVMLVGWLGFRLMGAIGVSEAGATWTGALRYAMSAMFIFTAVSHFHPRTRPDLIKMVPSMFPLPGLLVTLTGILEVLGAFGLLIPPLISPAALGLSGLLIAMFPANVYAAVNNLPIGGRPATPLAIRLPLQLFWIGALWWIARVER